MASIALSSLSISSILSKPSLLNCRNIRRIPFIRSAISSSSTSKKAEFNISFGSSSKENSSKNLESSSTPSVPFLIPWIVRGEDGKLQVQSTPPATLLHAMATANTSTPTKKKKKINATKGVLTCQPKHSKAARRYYNENFRDPPQRISKVLAASGVASRRKCEELVFEGSVTVNGSVCNTPQKLVISTLTRLFNETSEALGGQRAPPAKKREVDDNSKKMGALFAKLNSGDISKNAADKLVQLCHALDNGDFASALQIQVQMNFSTYD